MSYRDNCSVCGESYDDDNLATCQRCHISFCYRCGSFGRGICERCLERENVVPASVTEKASKTLESNVGPSQ